MIVMCKLCNEKPVYEFTNKRKLCKSCFVKYFQKKILYTIRKFHMIQNGDSVFYRKGRDFKSLVLEQMLRLISNKADIKLTSSDKNADRIPSTSSIDSEAQSIVKTLIGKKVSELKKELPVVGREIKPLYLLLDEEILLYAKLKNLKFKQEKKKESRVEKFENEMEKKHPEVKRAIVNSLLELYHKKE